MATALWRRMKSVWLLTNVVGLALAGCNRCEERNVSYTNEDVVPQANRSADDVIRLVGMTRSALASWQVDRATSGDFTFPAVPFEGSEDITLSIEVPRGRFRVTSEYQPGDWDCADSAPVAEAVLHIESSSGLLRERIPGSLSADGRYRFQGSVPQLEGDARSYDPALPRGYERRIGFDVTLFENSTPTRVAVTLIAERGKQRLAQVLLRTEE